MAQSASRRAIPSEALNPSAPTEDLGAYAGRYGEVRIDVVGDRLHVVMGRRPPIVLQAIGPDLFSKVGDPEMRVRFSREGDRVNAFDVQVLGRPGPRGRRTD